MPLPLPLRAECRSLEVGIAFEVAPGRFRIDIGGLGIAMPLLLARYSIWHDDKYEGL
jgi:hypothetical protein